MTRSSVKMCGLRQSKEETLKLSAEYADGGCTKPQEANGAEALEKI